MSTVCRTLCAAVTIILVTQIQLFTQAADLPATPSNPENIVRTLIVGISAREASMEIIRGTLLTRVYQSASHLAFLRNLRQSLPTTPEYVGTNAFGDRVTG